MNRLASVRRRSRVAGVGSRCLHPPCGEPASSAMKSRHIAVFLASLLGCASAQGAAVLVSDLGWLAGNWIGSLADGSVYESHYSDPDGGVIVGSSKETRANRVVGTDFELIYEKDGQVIFQPHPDGLKITLSGPDKDGKTRKIVIDLRRAL